MVKTWPHARMRSKLGLDSQTSTEGDSTRLGLSSPANDVFNASSSPDGGRNAIGAQCGLVC